MSLELICQRWIESAFNGTLQGILLTGFVAAILRGFPRINAATRHAVWFMTLLCVTMLPWLQGVRAIQAPFWKSGAAFASRRPVGVATGPQPVVVGSMGPGEGGRSPKRTDLLNDGELPMVEMKREWRPVGIDLDAPSGSEEPRPDAPRKWSIQLPPGVPIALVGLWLLLATIRVVRLVRELDWVCRLKARSLSPGVESERQFERLKESMGVGRRIRLRVGPGDCTPLLAGFLKPAVIVPAGFLEAGPTESVVQVLRHELGHVRRYDDWTNLIQQGLAAVGFFHPAVHWISRRLALDREIACDDHVLDAHSGARTYALLLTHFAGRKPGRDWIAAPGVWSRSTELKERIAMILNRNRNSSPRIAGATVAILLLATAGFAGAMLHAGPRAEVAGSDTSAGVGGEEAPVVTVVAEPAKESVSSEVSADSLGSSSSGTITQSSNPTELHESGLKAAPGSRKARTPKKAKSFAHAVEEVQVERMPADSLEERLARLERTLEEMKSSLKHRVADAQRSSRSPDLNLNINRDEIEKKVAEGQRRLQAAELALAGNQEGFRAQDDARREVERQVEFAWKLKGDRLIERPGDSERGFGTKTGTLDAERRNLEAVRKALEKELKKIDERIVKLKERQGGGTVNPDTKSEQPRDPETLQSGTQERNADAGSPEGR